MVKQVSKSLLLCIYIFVFCRNHFQSFVSGRADLCAGTAAGAVQSGNCQGELLVLGTLHGQGSGHFAFCHFFVRQNERTDNAVRTYIGTPVALHAVLHVPLRYICSDTTLFISSRTSRDHAVCSIQEGGNRNRITGQGVGRYQNLVQVFGLLLIAANQLLRFFSIFCGLPAFRYFHFMNVIYAGIHSSLVHLYDVFTLLAVGLLDGIFHVAYCIIDWNDVSQLEECCLQYCIGSSCTQTDFLCDGYGVAGVELYVVISDISLHLGRQVVIQFFIIPHTVQQEESARFHVLYHFISVQICRVMACNEVSLLYIVG